MPTARELLEQADALMRRNRTTATDDIPVLTDSVALPSGQPMPGVTPASARQAQAESAAEAVPVLTESVEVIDDDAAVEPVDVVAEGEPSDWLESERGEPSAIGEAPDSIVMVPSVLRATPRGAAAAAPEGFEEIELTTPAEDDFDEEFDEAAQHEPPGVLDLRLPQPAAAPTARADAPVLSRTDAGDDWDAADTRPALVEPGRDAEAIPIDTVADDALPEDSAPAEFADVDERGNRDVPEVDRGFVASLDGAAPAMEAAEPGPAGLTEYEDLADRRTRDDFAHRTEGVESTDPSESIDRADRGDRDDVAPREAIVERVDIVEPHAPVVHVERGDDEGEQNVPGDVHRETTPHMAEGPDAVIAMSVPSSSGAPGIPLQTTAFRMAADGAGAASVPYAIALPAAFAPLPVAEAAPPMPDAAAEAAAQAAEQAKWDALAEEVRMQVLQRIDLFTDTGMRDQLALRLQPIVDRASADLVATINQHVGLLLRGYVAEAIEREIENWRRNQ